MSERNGSPRRPRSSRRGRALVTHVAGLRRPHAKYAIGTTPNALINDTAAAHPFFEPRTSSEGRRERSTNAAILSTPSIALAATINLRVRGSSSFHLFFALTPRDRKRR